MSRADPRHTTDPIGLAQSAQTNAVDPSTSAWVSASAGSGKTTVLTNRVLALMLAGAEPQRILCLTFTKAAAAEMANRIMEKLGAWVNAPLADLEKDIGRLLDAMPIEDDIKRARQLFARALDAPGGMRIETIHAFCQSLLRRFPIEAGLSPQFELMDERTAAEALSEAREHIILAADASVDPDLAAAMAYMTGRLHETRFPEIVAQIAQQRAKLDRMFTAHGGVNDAGLTGAIAAVRAKLGLAPDETKQSVIETACQEASFDRSALKAAATALERGRDSDYDRSQKINFWLIQHDRTAGFEDYKSAFLTKEGAVRKILATKDIAGAHPSVIQTLQQEAARLEKIHDRIARLATLEATSALLCVAERLLHRYREYKAARSLLDYDDLIQITRRLLQTPDVAAWVLYKLDGGLDHILIDEAQDTNPDQWGIVNALSDEFFAGEGRYEDRAGRDALQRTVFAVGDRKQSIYSFQGADLNGFDRQYAVFARKVQGANRPWQPVRLNVSFRSTQAVLNAVDLVFAQGEARTGVALESETITHIAARSGHAGRVEVWPPVSPRDSDEQPPWKPPVERTQADSPQNRLACLIARRIAHMISHQEMLVAHGRPITAGDIMVLVRRRTGFVDELVRQLKTLDIPVAGVDRMVLPQQLAVMDLIALGQFLLLPSDDLTLATVLKSPLIGLSEEQLFDLAYPRGEMSLWDALSAHAGSENNYGRAHGILHDLLAKTDYLTPFALFSHVAVVRDGRRKALARLGFEADDPLDEFLALALAYEKSHPPSLQAFLHWVEQGEIEIKRDLEQGGGDAVRIMTVHGSKGLEAPIVFLPDTLQVPKLRDTLLWTDDRTPLLLWAPSSEGIDRFSFGLKDAAKATQLEEYRRLLYVAMTRAEDRLYVCGWESKKTAPQGNWYELIQAGLADRATKVSDDFLAEQNITASAEILLLQNEQSTSPKTKDHHASGAPALAIPAWVLTPAPIERDPPQPLAPSRAKAEPPVLSPLADDDQQRFQRGLIIHRLLQTLPDLPPPQRARAAQAFLARKRWAMRDEQKAAIISETLAVLENPDFAPLFAAGSMAEVPVVGLVGKHAVSGQVDRLAVTATDAWVIDYKTNRPPPREVHKVDPGYVFQMAVYRDVLRRIYPTKNVRCVLLWTNGPFTMEVPATLMDAALASVAA